MTTMGNPLHALRTVVRHARRATREVVRGCTDPAMWQSLQRCEALRNRHAGERCFVLGNGPSLKKTDLSRLRGEFTIGANRIYLAFDQLGFHTTYFVSVNKLVIEQCAGDIAGLPMTKFLSWDCRSAANFTHDTIFLRRAAGPAFYGDVCQGYWEGATVTYVGLQVAYHLGFKEVVLLGVDHNFTTKGEPHKEVVSSGEDPNHFHPEYFGKGFRWQLPDLPTSELAYRIADYVFRESGRRVLDATVDGHLRVFPRVDLESIT